MAIRFHSPIFECPSFCRWIHRGRFSSGTGRRHLSKRNGISVQHFFFFGDSWIDFFEFGSEILLVPIFWRDLHACLKMIGSLREFGFSFITIARRLLLVSVKRFPLKPTHFSLILKSKISGWTSKNQILSLKSTSKWSRPERPPIELLYNPDPRLSNSLLRQNQQRHLLDHSITLLWDCFPKKKDDFFDQPPEQR